MTSIANDKEVKFIHLRNHENILGEGAASDSDEITAWGGATLGYVEVETSDTDITLLFTMAKCAAWDNFNKTIGRNICAGRIRKGKDTELIKIPRSMARHEIHNLLKNKYYESEEQHWPLIRNYVY